MRNTSRSGKCPTITPYMVSRAKRALIKEIKEFDITKKTIDTASPNVYKNSEGKMRRKLVFRDEQRERFIKECKKSVDENMRDNWYKPYRNIGDPNIDKKDDELVPVATFEYHNKSIWRVQFGETDLTIMANADDASNNDVLSALDIDDFDYSSLYDENVNRDEYEKLMVDYVIEKHVPRLAKMMCKTISNTLSPDIAEFSLSLNERFSSALMREIASQLSI